MAYVTIPSRSRARHVISIRNGSRRDGFSVICSIAKLTLFLGGLLRRTLSDFLKGVLCLCLTSSNFGACYQKPVPSATDGPSPDLTFWEHQGVPGWLSRSALLSASASGWPIFIQPPTWKERSPTGRPLRYGLAVEVRYPTAVGGLQ